MNKKTIILIIVAVLLVLGGGIFVAIDSAPKKIDPEYTVNPEDVEQLDKQEDVTIIDEETSEEAGLSESCDKILATGKNKNGDYYELVANQNETYNSVKIEIGVIKNNEWLLKPTSDMPFIDKKTGLLNVEHSNVGLDDVKIADAGSDYVYGTFKYVADGCFCIYSDIRKNESWTGTPNCLTVYNAENGKIYSDTYDNSKYESGFVYTSFYKDAAYGNHLMIAKYYVIDSLPFDKTKWDFFVLDTETMETKRIVEDTEDIILGPACDGLFAVGEDSDACNSIIKYFYDLNGKRVIDLTTYNDGGVTEVDKAYFVDGKFSFNVENEAGTDYQVTIDTKGNVIDSVKS